MTVPGGSGGRCVTTAVAALPAGTPGKPAIAAHCAVVPRAASAGDTRTPHWFGNPGPEAAELLTLF